MRTYVIGHGCSVANAAMRWDTTGWSFSFLRFKWIWNQSRCSQPTDLSSDWRGLSDCENKEHRFRALTSDTASITTSGKDINEFDRDNLILGTLAERSISPVVVARSP